MKKNRWQILCLLHQKASNGISGPKRTDQTDIPFFQTIVMQMECDDGTGRGVIGILI